MTRKNSSIIARQSAFITCGVNSTLTQRHWYGQRVTCPVHSNNHVIVAALQAGEEQPKGKVRQVLNWLEEKMMHNFQNVSYGYEPYFKEAERMREERQKSIYAEMDKKKKEDKKGQKKK